MRNNTNTNESEQLLESVNFDIFLAFTSLMFLFFCYILGTKYCKRPTIVEEVQVQAENAQNDEPPSYEDDNLNYISFMELNSGDIENNNIENTSNIICSICLEEYKYNDIIAVMKCDHKFHPQCLYTWKKKSNTCPLCNNS